MNAHTIRSSFATLLIGGALLASMTSMSPAQAGERGERDKAAMLGAAAGLVGGVLLGGALTHNNDRAEPAPVYDAPRPVYREVAPVYVRPVHVAPDHDFDRLSHLKHECDDGDTGDCIRFGILIGEHKEREAQWRRRNPDMFAWDRN